jgi:hypothetical protein
MQTNFNTSIGSQDLVILNHHFFFDSAHQSFVLLMTYVLQKFSITTSTLGLNVLLLLSPLTDQSPAAHNSSDGLLPS